ncbi:MAG: rhamnogalacturonan acetylesterase [Sphingobacteriaceae bacterium]
MKLNLLKAAFVVLAAILFSFTFIKDAMTVYIVGDSTASIKKPAAFPETGWGMELGTFFDSEVKVDNRAVNGRSTKSFINENKWQAVLDQLAPGDFVLIQFGHNDEKLDKPEIGTTLAEYKTYLIRYVSETRAKKANPILLTPIARRNFKNGELKDTHMGYPDVVRKVADSLHVPFIDMQVKTAKLLTETGEEASKKLFNFVEPGHPNYPEGKQDNTHLSLEGAKQVAALVAEGIKETKTKLAKHLK